MKYEDCKVGLPVKVTSISEEDPEDEQDVGHQYLNSTGVISNIRDKKNAHAISVTFASASKSRGPGYKGPDIMEFAPEELTLVSATKKTRKRGKKERVANLLTQAATLLEGKSLHYHQQFLPETSPDLGGYRRQYEKFIQEFVTSIESLNHANKILKKLGISYNKHMVLDFLDDIREHLVSKSLRSDKLLDAWSGLTEKDE